MNWNFVDRLGITVTVLIVVLILVLSLATRCNDDPDDCFPRVGSGECTGGTEAPVAPDGP